MDVGGVTTLGALVALIAANQLIRFPIARRVPILFWLILVANGVVAIGALAWGLPGLVMTANWIVAALFLYHLVQNLQARSQWFAEERNAGEDFRAWIERAGGVSAIAATLKDLDEFPKPEENEDFYVDFGETGPYEKVLGESECAV